MQPPSTTSDSTLIQRVLSGDVHAFGNLVSRYERLARAIALRSVRESHTAEDVVQESFLAAYRSLGSLKKREQFGVWLQGIVRRRAASAISNARRLPACEEMNERADASQRYGLMESSVELLELLDRLPEHERLVIALKHFEGHSASDIANITGQSIGTITKQLTRARRRLHGWLAEEEQKHDQSQNH